VLPPGGYGTTIVTRLSGNAALQENAASARLHTKRVLVSQAFEETKNGFMIFSLQKLVRVAKRAKIEQPQWPRPKGIIIP
jgi:hypothetical protein